MINDESKHSEMTNDTNLVWQLLVKKRKFVLLTTLLITITVYVFTSPWVIKPKYKSEIIVYPPGTNSAKIFIERDPRFGADKEIDEHIQIFESVKLRDSIIHKYDLVTHYNIDTAGPTKAYQLHAEYNDNIKIDRTRYNSIMVTVYDTDPVLAAAIANDIITIGDKVKNEIIHTNLMQIFYSIEREFKLKSNALDEMALKVNAATKSTIAEGAKIATLNTTDIIRQQANIQSYIKVYTEQRKNDLARLLQQYLNLMESYFLLQQNYLQAFTNANSDVPSCYIISPAEVSYKKAFPPRLLLTLAGGAFGFFTAWFIVIVINKFNQP
ncbi:MAG TPA: hypothetical protein PK736_08355 [Bacteroidia bacterium]|nr:hypothetical protein [Bacteroidia bacterium]